MRLHPDCFHTTVFATFVSLATTAVLVHRAGAQPREDTATFYVGTYTRGESQGVYQCRLNLKSGQAELLGLAAETVNPSFLAIHPNKSFLYAVGEMSDFQGKKTGAVNAFAIDPKTGDLTLLNQQSSQGAGPCHLVVDRAGKNVLVANYGGGSAAVLPIGADGRLGEANSTVQHEGSSVNPNRQKGPHAHSINLDAANRFAFVADLGLDKVLIYRFHPDKGTLTPNDPAFAKVQPGAGPRHFAFHPSGKFAYVINELDLTITAFEYDAGGGSLHAIETVSTVPDGIDRTGFSTAEVQIHPSGKFLYGSNRGHNSIVVFSIDTATGRLTHVENEPTQGKTPRNFAIDPTGTFLLAENQDSASIVVLRIDQQTGALTPTGYQIEIPSPVCIKFR